MKTRPNLWEIQHFDLDEPDSNSLWRTLAACHIFTHSKHSYSKQRNKRNQNNNPHRLRGAQKQASGKCEMQVSAFALSCTQFYLPFLSHFPPLSVPSSVASSLTIFSLLCPVAFLFAVSLPFAARFSSSASAVFSSSFSVFSLRFEPSKAGINLQSRMRQNRSHAHTRMHIYTIIYTYMHTYVRTYIRTYVRMSVCLSVCMYVCMCGTIYIYIYTYTYYI